MKYANKSPMANTNESLSVLHSWFDSLIIDTEENMYNPGASCSKPD